MEEETLKENFIQKIKDGELVEVGMLLIFSALVLVSIIAIVYIALSIGLC